MTPRIVVPFDFSETAARALAWAADLSITTNGEAIRLVHVISTSPSGTPNLPVDLVLPDEEALAGLKRSMMEEAAKHQAVVTTDVIVRTSPIGDSIVEFAREARADLIVIGSHGRTGLKRLFLGSVAEYVIRHAPCPVVTVRANLATF